MFDINELHKKPPSDSNLAGYLQHVVMSLQQSEKTIYSNPAEVYRHIVSTIHLVYLFFQWWYMFTLMNLKSSASSTTA